MEVEYSKVVIAYEIMKALTHSTLQPVKDTCCNL